MATTQIILGNLTSMSNVQITKRGRKGLGSEQFWALFPEQVLKHTELGSRLGYNKFYFETKESDLPSKFRL